MIKTTIKFIVGMGILLLAFSSPLDAFTMEEIHFMPQGKLESLIRAKVKSEWPNNYRMQVYELKRYAKAAKYIKAVSDLAGKYKAQGDIATFNLLFNIMDKAVGEWGIDLPMVEYVVKQQIKAYSQLHGGN